MVNLRESLQPLYNLMDRAAYEAALEPLCRAENIGVINFFGQIGRAHV